MAHYKLMYPNEYLSAPDLLGKDVSAVIKKIEIEEVVGSDGKKQRKPVVWFEGKAKRLVLCKTNAKSIAKLHGTDTEAWLNKKVTVYPTTCMAFGSEVECIRIR
jgi:hypothetical protein